MENKTISAGFKSKKLTAVPRGFRTFITNAGIKDNTLDLGIVVSDVPAAAAAVFTRNQVKGNPVLVGMKHIKGSKISAVVVNSKNSNVATGKQGYDDCVRICNAIASEAGFYRHGCSRHRRELLAVAFRWKRSSRRSKDFANA